MTSVDIQYKISLKDETEDFVFKLDEDTFELAAEQSANLPKWAELDYKQCAHCPLEKAEHSHCPVAVQLVPLVECFDDAKSIDEAEMEVITDERRVIQTTSLQRAIASILELVFPSCGCPKTEAMRPLSRFHLPLASEEENVFRVTGMYLLGQYFKSVGTGGGKIEFQGLIDMYGELSILNKAVASRIQNATHSDAVKNAITLLDMYSTLVPLLLEDELVEMRGFFKAFLPEGEPQQAPVGKTNYLQSIKDANFELVDLDAAEDDTPEWLKEVKAEGGGAAEPALAKEEPNQRIDDILSGSGLELSLEPTDEEKPVTGKAVFNFPDD